MISNGMLLLGAPSSAGAFAPGQEKAPAALRAAGLIAKLQHAGMIVRDVGDVQSYRWRADPAYPTAMNVDAVCSVAREVGEKLATLRSPEEFALVVGGDCTVGVGTILGFEDKIDTTGIIYFDLHPDLNVPGKVPAGALDWMSPAHLLALEGADKAFRTIGNREPLIDRDQIVFFSYGAEKRTDFERSIFETLKPHAIECGAVAQDPPGAAINALAFMDRFDRFLVHFDVDTVNFLDTPLSENADHHGGLSLATAMAALQTLLASPKCSALTITELNPLHGEEDGSTLADFTSRLAGAFEGD